MEAAGIVVSRPDEQTGLQKQGILVYRSGTTWRGLSNDRHSLNDRVKDSCSDFVQTICKQLQEHTCAQDD